MRLIPQLPIFLLIAGLSGCASAPKNATEAAEPVSSTALLEDSAITITYILGNTRHEIQAQAIQGQASAKSLSDRRVMKEKRIEAKQYQELAEKVRQYLAQPASPSGDHSNCHSPFILSLRIEKNAKTLSGCRTSPEGLAISRIARETEFLLYSKN